MNILTTRGYVDCLQFKNYRFLSSFKETIHFEHEYAPVAVLFLLNGLRIIIPGSVMVETVNGIIPVSDIKFGTKLIMHKNPSSLERIREMCNLGKKRRVSEDAWYVDFDIYSHEEMVDLYLATGCCLKVRPSTDRYIVSIPSDILNILEPDVINIDKERDPVEIVKDIKIVTDLCIKTNQTVDHWTKVVINGFICYNIR